MCPFEIESSLQTGFESSLESFFECVYFRLRPMLGMDEDREDGNNLVDTARVSSLSLYEGFFYIGCGVSPLAMFEMNQNFLLLRI